MRRAAAAAAVVNYLHTHTYTGETHTHTIRHSAVYVAHTRCCLKYGGKFTLLLSSAATDATLHLPLSLPLPLSLLFSLLLSERPLHGCFSVGFLLFFLEIAVKNNKAPHEFLASPSRSLCQVPSASFLLLLASFRFVFFKFYNSLVIELFLLFVLVRPSSSCPIYTLLLPSPSN